MSFQRFVSFFTLLLPLFCVSQVKKPASKKSKQIYYYSPVTFNVSMYTVENDEATTVPFNWKEDTIAHFYGYPYESNISLYQEHQNQLSITVDTLSEVEQTQYFDESLRFEGKNGLDYYKIPRKIVYIDAQGKQHVQSCHEGSGVSFRGMRVYITNATDTAQAFYYRNPLEIIQEALDKNGNWRPIEQPVVPECGQGFGWRQLLPNQYVVISALKYKGNYKTLLRIKLTNGNGIIYSQPYRGSINYSQFDYNKLVFLDDIPYEKVRIRKK